MIKYHLNTADMEMVTLSHYADDDFERVSMNIGMGPKATDRCHSPLSKTSINSISIKFP